MKIELLDNTLIFCAMRQSGKSALMKYLIEKQRELFKEIFLISPTEQINNQFSDIVKPEFIFDEYNEEWMNSLIERMTEINKSKKTKEEKTHILLILDDCCSDSNLSKMPSFKKIFTRGRHIGITIFVSAQYVYHVSPLIRSNSDFFLVGQLNNSSIEKLMDEFLRGDFNKSQFKELYHNSTNNFYFLVINNQTTKDNHLEEIYGKIKAKIFPQ
jgi:hypothetical protein